MADFYIKSTKRVTYSTVFKGIIPNMYKKFLFQEKNLHQQLLELN